MFLSRLGTKPILRQLPFRYEYRNRNNCPDLFMLDCISGSAVEEVNAWNVGVQLYVMLLGRLPFSANKEDIIGRSLRGNWVTDINTTLKK